MIELRQFKQFIAVAEELSFRRAAERLHMAQPPLTTAIRKLEEELGVVLLERSNRITALTQAGQTLLIEARRAIGQVERAIHVTRLAGTGLSGSLRISFVTSGPTGFLPLVLQAFRARHPQVELDLQEASSYEQVLALEQDRCDIGLIVLPVRDTSVPVQLVVDERLVAALPAQHALASQPTVTLADMAHEPWVLFPEDKGPGMYNMIVTSCALAGYRPRIVQRGRQMETIVSLVSVGVGVALVPSSMAHTARDGVVFREVTGIATPLDYQLAIATGIETPLVLAFTAVAAEIAQQRKG